MDPKTALRLCDQAISDLDKEAAVAYLASYREWRAGGGFEPLEVAGTLLRGDAFAAYCEQRLETTMGGLIAQPTKVRVSSDHFFLTHGKRPRGRGHWAFFMGGNPEPYWAVDEQGNGNLTFTAAKQAAVAEAKRRGVYSVEVGS